MRLDRVRVVKYKCIIDSDEFEVSDVTALVGKNESGKTAILEALHRLNPMPDQPVKFEVELDYPASLQAEYEQAITNDGEAEAVVSAWFELDDDDMATLADKVGAGVVVSSMLAIARDYQNEFKVTLDFDERALASALVTSADLPESFARSLGSASTVAEIVERLESDSELPPEVGRFLKHTKGIAVSPQGYCYDAIKDRVPRFLYFDEYYLMNGQVNIPRLVERKNANSLEDSDRPMLGLIALAGLTVDELQKPTRTEVVERRLERATNNLGSQVLRHWSQNANLEVRFVYRRGLAQDEAEMRGEYNLRGRIYNSRHKASTPLGRRSRGFVWFFSFLAWFSQQKKSPFPLILLLDEPGLSLHARAQEDLLRYIDTELRPHHQVIYTTHSPFMVDPRHFGRIRVVEDRDIEEDNANGYGSSKQAAQGTKVITDVFTADTDSLFPLQGALGYEICQTLFIGPYSLIVEGVSDLLYLSVMSGLLERKGRERLDSRWVITPVGGSGKVPAFVSLLGAQKGLTIATLLDISSEDKQSIQELYKKKLLKKKNVMTYADFADGEQADVEDMFEIDFYLNLVNAEYASELGCELKKTGLPTQHPRIVYRLAKHFETAPMNGAQFSHYRPARYFSDHLADLEADVSDATCERFENAFKALNALLPKR